MFSSCSPNETEPTKFSNLVKCLKWREVIQQEIEVKNRTWTVTTLTSMKKALGCKWVYKIKLKSDGMLARYKACLVIMGNNHIAREDFTNPCC